ncbi:DUF6660 family protein [Aquimarina longa]|uniref:DUF6660 family protein n=1 Tax=Aquimarina longa TaxID=1080221 RepID=UPI003B8464CF
MKFLTIILSIYILGLSFITCNDNVIEYNDGIVQLLNADEHSDSEESDLCSPFCSCQCCQISITETEFDSYDYLISNYQYSKVYSYKNIALQDFDFSLFQPPRI